MRLKPGDKVRCIKKTPLMTTQIGTVYTVRWAAQDILTLEGTHRLYRSDCFEPAYIQKFSRKLKDLVNDI